PALFGSDHPEILGLGLGAFTGTAADRELEFVGGADALVAVLQIDGELDAVLYAIATPGAAHTAFHRAHRFAVGLARLKARIHQTLPDDRQLVQLGAEQVDALAAGDLGVEPEVTSHLTQDNEFLRGDFTAGNARHHGEGAVLLHVGQIGVVGVLQAHVLLLEHVVVPDRGQDVAHRGLTDVATQTLAVTITQLNEGFDAFHPHDMLQLLTGVGEVFAQGGADFHAQGGHLVVHHFLQLGGTTAATSGGLGTILHLAQRRRPAILKTGHDVALGDVVAGADGAWRLLMEA